MRPGVTIVDAGLRRLRRYVRRRDVLQAPEHLIRQLDAVSSVRTEDDLALLEDALHNVDRARCSPALIAALLRVFERFPTDDAFGVFWTVLHVLESLPGYVPLLVQSVQARPSEFSIRMVHRLLNSDVRTVDGVDLLALVESIARDPTQPPVIRAAASR